jgi:hypothetical protein
MKKTIDEPSPGSLRALPEVDFSKFRRLTRGRYVARARRSFAVALIDPELYARFGSSQAIDAALRAVVEASKTVALTRRAKPRRTRRGPRRQAA